GVDLTNDDDYVVTYAYRYYDDADRPIASISHGTGTDGSGNNGWVYGAEPSYSFTDVPQFTDDGTGGSPDVEGLKALLTTYAYEADTGRRNLVTTATGTADPLSQIPTKIFFDDLGRTTHVAESYHDFDPANPSTIGGGDRVTAFAYDGLGNTVSQTAYNEASVNYQVTEYLYTDSVSASRPTLMKYPDGNTTPNGDNITTTYNVDGSINTRRDQRGVVMTYRYTDGRRQLDVVDATTIPLGVDDAVQSIGYSYDELARVEKVTSYDDVSTGTPGIVNEVAYTFNDLGKITNSYQDHDGAASSADPTVTYSYDLGATSSVYNDGARLSHVYYPGNIETTTTRRTIGYGYADAYPDRVNDRFDRPLAVWAEDATEYKQRAVTYSSAMGRRGYRVFNHMDDNGGTNMVHRPWYATSDDGYDRFGRTAQVRYTRTGTKVELNYGYDAGSNLLYREDARAAAETTPQDLDELYGRDRLSRLNHFQVGGLNANKDAITSADFEQEWLGLDNLGNPNWFLEDRDGNGSYETELFPVVNDANEITDFAASSGPDWVDPTYDAAGNMTKRPAPEDPGDANDAHDITYDAWNRVVKIEDSTGTIATYEYDGLGRRIEKTVGADTYDYYHNESWQVVEVRKNDDANPIEQFLYDTNYVDALLIRWYDADTDGDLSDAGDGEQYYVYDASFNVIALLDDAGATLERYRYTPYGQRIVLDLDFSADSDNTTDYGNQRGFQGLLHDEESGLIENRARMLDPLTGRFIQRDPLGYPDGMNAYAAYHVMRDGVDPWGLCNDEGLSDCERRAIQRKIDRIEALSQVITARSVQNQKDLAQIVKDHNQLLADFDADFAQLTNDFNQDMADIQQNLEDTLKSLELDYRKKLALWALGTTVASVKTGGSPTGAVFIVLGSGLALEFLTADYLWDKGNAYRDAANAGNAEIANYDTQVKALAQQARIDKAAIEQRYKQASQDAADILNDFREGMRGIERDYQDDLAKCREE
ncbi:MAG: RHS repeat-associated core domain-containing protein, partial [Phycisphaeraceae bacterium]|nr:RHS repeat-associated core domain-containing protein [Phycisphaeraceae bacterium]